MKGTKLSLSERIALAAGGAQEEEYPEDIEYETSAKVVEKDDDDDRTDVRPRRSSLRTKNVQLLDELDTRYAGAKVSRKKLEKTSGNNEVTGSESFSKKVSRANNDLDEDSDNDESGDDEEISGKDSSDEGLDLEDDDEMGEGVTDEEDGEEDSDASESEEDEEDNASEFEDEDKRASGVQTLSIQDKEAEIERGRATLNQIKLWDSLLEVRIRLQKVLIDCNRLPHTEDFDNLIKDIELSDENANLKKLLEKSQESTKALTHDLLRLQSILIKQNSETRVVLDSKADKDGSSSGDPMDEEITSDEDIDNEEMYASLSNRKRKIAEDPNTGLDLSSLSAKKSRPEDFCVIAEKTFVAFKPYRNQTIQKWNDKTQFAGGKFNKKQSHQVSTLKQIDQILSNKERLIKRTQVKRSKYSIIGKSAPDSSAVEESQGEQLDPEVFDDDDFYHQLLRELIERKTANVNDPIQLSHHWLELQKLRTKLKKKVDTKASKGRKIRYDVHSKLVNFMAPNDTSTMSNAAVKELFSSLFGKVKE